MMFHAWAILAKSKIRIIMCMRNELAATAGMRGRSARIAMKITQTPSLPVNVFRSM
jgi:hypothetical protein